MAKRNKKVNKLDQQYMDIIQFPCNWGIDELKGPRFYGFINAQGVQRKDDILGVYVSGDASTPKNLNGHEAIAGFDVLVYEMNPKIDKGESNINIYHYIIEGSGLEYNLRGPFISGALQAHWPESLNLDPYYRAFEEAMPCGVGNLCNLYGRVQVESGENADEQGDVF